MSWVKIGVSVVGAGVSFLGARKKAKGVRAQAESQALALQQNSQIAMMNSQIALQQAAMQTALFNFQASAATQIAGAIAHVSQINAKYARASAQIRADQSRRLARKFLGTQRSRYGKSGVQLDGTPLLVMSETAAELEFDALLLEFDGDLQAFQFLADGEIQRAQMMNQAGVYAMQGAIAAEGGRQQSMLFQMEAAHLRERAGATISAGNTTAKGIEFGGALSAAGTFISLGGVDGVKEAYRRSQPTKLVGVINPYTGVT